MWIFLPVNITFVHFGIQFFWKKLITNYASMFMDDVSTLSPFCSQPVL